MVSVLVPIFNHPVSELIGELHRQCSKLGQPFEIICIEDGSRQYLEENASIGQLPHTRYIVAHKNIGRAAIRNKLANIAKYKALIFLDCDSRIERPDFIEKYMAAIAKYNVVYGGTTYAERPEKAHRLHHTYGVKREARSLSMRKTDPYTCFLTNNFSIKKGVFDAIKFDESLTQYGFEDSLFAWELKKSEIQIAHIDNPVEHTGLDTSSAFIEKTKLAIENIHTLIQAEKLPMEEIRLAKVYFTLKSWRLAGVVCVLIGSFEDLMLKALGGTKPVLLFFDLLKLKWMRDAEKKLNTGHAS